jgi:hypothetical protein
MRQTTAFHSAMLTAVLALPMVLSAACKGAPADVEKPLELPPPPPPTAAPTTITPGATPTALTKPSGAPIEQVINPLLMPQSGFALEDFSLGIHSLTLMDLGLKKPLPTPSIVRVDGAVALKAVLTLSDCKNVTVLTTTGRSELNFDGFSRLVVAARAGDDVPAAVSISLGQNNVEFYRSQSYPLKDVRQGWDQYKFDLKEVFNGESATPNYKKPLAHYSLTFRRDGATQCEDKQPKTIYIGGLWLER